MHFLRRFDLGGAQLGVTMLPGPCVALAALEELLLVVFHAAPAFPTLGDQRFGFMVPRASRGRAAAFARERECVR